MEEQVKSVVDYTSQLAVGPGCSEIIHYSYNFNIKHMVKQLCFVAATILGLTFSSCTNDINEEIIADASGTLSNTKTEVIKLESGFTVTKENGVYSMGDILLSEEQVKLLDETGSIYPAQAISVPDDSIMVSPIAGTKVIYPTSATRAVGRHPNENVFWSMVRYVIDPSLTTSERNVLRSAIQHIESRTNVRFYNATGQPTVDPTYGFAYPYVNVQNNAESATVSNSYVGRIGGRQNLNIGSACGVGVVAHELCHACAMYHEHCRYDRDNYITVYTNNVEDDALNDVRKITSNYYTRGAFDFNSIMLYGSYTFSKNGQATMLKKDGSTFSQNSVLSDLDRAWLNYFYLPYIARSDVYRELDDVVYDGNNNVLTGAQRIELQAALNNGNPTPPSGGRIPNVH